MRYYNGIVFYLLAIVWFPQTSECKARIICQDLLLKFNDIQIRKLEKTQRLSQERLPARSNSHSHSDKKWTQEVERIGYSGALFVDASTFCLRDECVMTTNGKRLRATCPFLKTIPCNRSAIYRTIDGSCNNLDQPYWGRANTPYRRLQDPDYADGISLPRCESVAGGPLPGPRYISVGFHRNSDIGDLNNELSHLIMSFGQFLNHELGSTVLHKNKKIDCCRINQIASCPNITCRSCIRKVFFERCLPIEVPPNDPYFSQYRRNCLPFTRALPTPNLQCSCGPKEQLNAQTSYIDSSQVYGASLQESNSLRTMTGGLLKITPTDDLDILPHDNRTFCKTPKNYCFIAGDFRVNQNYMLITLHTLFVREHNRIAELLARADPSLDDENLFQKARQILIAQTQHIVYNEYLPHILGESRMRMLGLNPLVEGYTQYEPQTQASITNAHIGAAFRFGHSMIRRTFSNGRGDQILLSPSLGLTDPFYQPGDAASGFTTGLLVDLSQEVDRLLTDQVTDKLFESSPGQGNDLASLNIQRGRDIGLSAYTKWRQWCGLDVPDDFIDLTDHSEENRIRLRMIYQNVHDIDLWTGGLSEIHLDGASVGPTFACILAEQFRAIKYGDRFWYEHSGPTQLSPSQIDSIRQTSLSRIFCDNTHINMIQTDPFLVTNVTRNNLVNCDSLMALNICPFVQRWSDWSNWSECIDNFRNRTRNCVGPVKGPCACAPDQSEISRSSCT